MSPSLTRASKTSHRTMLLIAVGIVASAVFLVSACTTDAPPDGVPGISGTVTSSETRPDGTGTLLVEGPKQPQGAVSDRAQVTVNEDTRYFDSNGKRLSERPRLLVGTDVNVWFTGPVAESYPVQGTAAVLQLVD